MLWQKASINSTLRICHFSQKNLITLKCTPLIRQPQRRNNVQGYAQLIVTQSRITSYRSPGRLLQ